MGEGGVGKLFKFYKRREVFLDFFLMIIVSSGK